MCTCLKRIISTLVLFVAVLLIQSCATRQQTVIPASLTADPNEITVFYDSDPPGAILYDLGKNERLGETPFWASYRLSEKELQEGIVLLDPSRVVWPSGATASNHPGIDFELKKGREQTYTFTRPDFPGGEADYEAGLKRMMHRITNGEGKQP